MPISASLIVFLLYLCVHFTCSNARSLLLEAIDRRSSNLSIKVGEKIQLDSGVEKVAGQLEENSSHKIPGTPPAAATHEELKATVKPESGNDPKHEKEADSDSLVSTKPLVSFSTQRRPQKNNRKPSPGIFSDYSRPRMRPPSHN